MNMQLTVVVGADWTLHPWRHNSSNVGGVTAGQARHNSSNVVVSLRARWDTTLVNICYRYLCINGQVLKHYHV